QPGLGSRRAGGPWAHRAHTVLIRMAAPRGQGRAPAPHGAGGRGPPTRPQWAGPQRRRPRRAPPSRPCRWGRLRGGGNRGPAGAPRRRRWFPPGVVGGAAGRGGGGFGGPAVVLQRPELGVDGVLGRPDEVRSVEAAAAGTVADEVVALAGQGPTHVSAKVQGEDRVPAGGRGIRARVDAPAGVGGAGGARNG